MIYRFTGILDSDFVTIYGFENEFNNIAIVKNQVAVDIYSDYKNCEVIEIEGKNVDVNTLPLKLTFILEEDVKEFLKTRLLKDCRWGTIELDLPKHYGNAAK